ncbi:dnl-type zinc finger protein [Phtheirospermum japonicum]|uniref:Dnl-type zinc finger protein n=1 Tax=Phtheirospermum japonicum TaxID=374723 RepID=A0A830C6E1_9LAMI|nr:dnl-type zinc finger protein [Phtheirospermum japonicum]
MAARRILSLIAAKMPQNPFPREVSRNFRPSPNSFSRSYEQYIRGFQSIAEATTQPVENQVKPETHTSISNPGTSKCTSVSDTKQTCSSSITHQVNSNLKVSERHDLAMIFTCKVCEARSIKTVCRESYEKGVVVARCDGCSNLHLIADRLGWFGEPGSVEEFLAARGEEVKKGSVDTFNLTLEDLAGKKDI